MSRVYRIRRFVGSILPPKCRDSSRDGQVAPPAKENACEGDRHGSIIVKSGATLPGRRDRRAGQHVPRMGEAAGPEVQGAAHPPEGYPQRPSIPSDQGGTYKYLETIAESGDPESLN